MNENLFESMLTAFSEQLEDRLFERIIDRIERHKETTERKKSDNETYLTINELAELTGLKRATIYAKRSRRELPAYKFGRELRFKRSEVDAWISSKQLTCLQDGEGGEG